MCKILIEYPNDTHRRHIKNKKTYGFYIFGDYTSLELMPDEFFPKGGFAMKK